MDNPQYTETQLNAAIRRATSANIYVIGDGDEEQPTFEVYLNDDLTDARIEDLGAAFELYAVDGATHHEIARAQHFDTIADQVIDYLENRETEA